MDLNYQKICQDLLRDLPQRQKEVLLRRFALVGEEAKERETLESIGKNFNITRERVRQIETDGLSRIKQKIKKYQTIFNNFNRYFKNKGGLKRETVLLTDLGNKKYQSQVYFLLTIGENFERIGENEDFYPLWFNEKKSLDAAKKTIGLLYNKLKETKKPSSLKELISFSTANESFLSSCLETSKVIQKNSEGLYGLKDWPEINPRGVKDKAYLILKKKAKPLHFSEVANLIENANLQTVHNELIRDSRFVLVGRGIYALKDWGYYPGEVKEVILKVLQEGGRPLTKEEVSDRVLKQRLVKENTILLNLGDKKYFFRNNQGKYTIREA